MDERKENSFAPPAVGGISLLVVFAVLCLTVFALLSLSTVRADARLADTSAQATENYYAADCAAQEILARLRSGEAPAEATSHGYDSWHAGTRYTYACPISDTQNLEVEVIVDGTDYEILRWQACYSGEWTETEGLDIWDGEDFGLFTGDFDGMLFE